MAGLEGLPDWTPAMVLALIGCIQYGRHQLFSGYLATRYEQEKNIKCNLCAIKRSFSIIYLYIFYHQVYLIHVVFGVTFGFLWLSTVPANKWNCGPYIWHKIR